MKLLKVISWIALTGGVLLVVLGLIAPSDYHMERTTVIGAPRAAVFPHVRYWAKWRAWSPWAERDPAMKFVVTGKDGTVGSTYIWTGDPELSGQGKMQNTGVIENEEMAYHLHFLVPFESHADGYFRLRDVAEATEVTWGFYGRHRFPQKVILLFIDMEEMLTNDFDHGLGRLKEIVEKESGE